MEAIMVLAHTGVKERSGRYKWGSGDRPYQRLEKTGKRLFRIEKKREAAQAKADKDFAKAEKRANSIFSTQKRVNKAFEKAVESQRAVTRLEYKGSQIFQKTLSKIGESNINSPEFKDIMELGDRYIKAAHENSKSMRNVAMLGGRPEHISKGKY